ncbi:MAG: hypothetical protein DLM63_06245 [Solirubrobacterales bacterium]|nr:MAG: hypothetical protein DLM63_06245 [Solirubrobacterales bacterium]
MRSGVSAAARPAAGGRSSIRDPQTAAALRGSWFTGLGGRVGVGSLGWLCRRRVPRRGATCGSWLCPRRGATCGSWLCPGRGATGLALHANEGKLELAEGVTEGCELLLGHDALEHGEQRGDRIDPEARLLGVALVLGAVRPAAAAKGQVEHSDDLVEQQVLDAQTFELSLERSELLLARLPSTHAGTCTA